MYSVYTAVRIDLYLSGTMLDDNKKFKITSHAVRLCQMNILLNKHLNFEGCTYM